MISDDLIKNTSASLWLTLFWLYSEIIYFIFTEKTNPCSVSNIFFNEWTTSVSGCYVLVYNVCLFLELLYNLTADVDKRQKSQPSRVYFIQSGSQISQMSNQLSLNINREECQRYTAYVKVRFGFILASLLLHLVLCCSCPQLLSQLLSHDPEHSSSADWRYDLFAYMAWFLSSCVWFLVWASESWYFHLKQIKAGAK